MGNLPMAPYPTSDQKRNKSLVRLCIVWPLLSVAFISGAFIMVRRSIPAQWVVHIDGRGNSTDGSWWTLFGGVMVLAGLAFVLGQYLARDFTNLGHWYPQQKGIVVSCFAFGFACLGLFVGNVFSAWNHTGDATLEASMGYGLLSFVAVAIVTGVLYTWLLPKAQQIT